MLDDILEEFEPKETITIIVERRWKYRNPTKIVKQLWEIPVLVIRNTGKAILVTKEGGSSWADGKRNEALWIPSFAMDAVSDKKYKIRYAKIDGLDFTRFVKKFGYKPKQELEESFKMLSFTEYINEGLKYAGGEMATKFTKMLNEVGAKKVKTINAPNKVKRVVYELSYETTHGTEMWVLFRESSSSEEYNNVYRFDKYVSSDGTEYEQPKGWYHPENERTFEVLSKALRDARKTPQNSGRIISTIAKIKSW